MRVVSSDVARHVRAHLNDTADDEAADPPGGAAGWPSAEQVGRALAQLRIGTRHRSGRERWREITRDELDALVAAHGGATNPTAQ